jgi:hypothetical protein
MMRKPRGVVSQAINDRHVVGHPTAAKAKVLAVSAGAIERDVRIAYEARQRPPIPELDPANGCAEVWAWLRDEAAAMQEIAERLIPSGWIWGIQMEVFPPGLRLLLNSPKGSRRR